LRDAADYITKLPKAKHSAPKWQAAMEALILVAENVGPTMLARIGVMRALNRRDERVFDPDLKSHHWGKRKLKRDEECLKPQISGGLFAPIGDDFVADLCAFSEWAKSGPFDRGDMDKHVLAAAVRLDEAITLGRVEPLHSTCRHVVSPYGILKLEMMLTGFRRNKRLGEDLERKSRRWVEISDGLLRITPAGMSRRDRPDHIGRQLRKGWPIH
jgi:hypothetical protein